MGLSLTSLSSITPLHSTSRAKDDPASKMVPRSFVPCARNKQSERKVQRRFDTSFRSLLHLFGIHCLLINKRNFNKSPLFLSLLPILEWIDTCAAPAVVVDGASGTSLSISAAARLSFSYALYEYQSSDNTFRLIKKTIVARVAYFK